MIDLVLKPIARRIGTLIAGYAAALGASADQQAQLAVGAIAVVGITADLALSKWEKTRIARRLTGRGN